MMFMCLAVCYMFYKLLKGENHYFCGRKLKIREQVLFNIQSKKIYLSCMHGLLDS